MLVRHDSILLYSGGLDSLIAWEYLGRPFRLYHDLKHKYAKQELWAMPHQCPDGVDHSFDLSAWEEPDATIPCRNFILAMSAARYTNKVLLIVQKDEMSIPDRTADFLKSTSEMLSYMYDRPITVRTPFADMDKVDMVQWWMDNKLGTKRLVDAWTCYSPVPISGVPERQHVAYRECGDCPACIRKYIALSYCGVEIKGHFAQDPKSSETGIRYKQRAQDGEFSVERTERTLKVLK